MTTTEDLNEINDAMDTIFSGMLQNTTVDVRADYADSLAAVKGMWQAKSPAEQWS